MKNNLRLVLFAVIALLLSKTGLTITYPTVTLSHTFNESSGSIDINSDDNPDFEIEYVPIDTDVDGGSDPVSSYVYRIRGIKEENQMFVGNNNELLKALPINIEREPIYVSILPYQTLIEVPEEGAARIVALQSESLFGYEPVSSWSNRAYIVGEFFEESYALLAAPPLLVAQPPVATNGYIGVYYYDDDSDSYYTGWLHYLYISPGVIRILSAGSAPSSGTPVLAGAGDPYGGATVPVSIIGSLIALLAIGGGSYLKRKRKK